MAKLPDDTAARVKLLSLQIENLQLKMALLEAQGMPLVQERDSLILAARLKAKATSAARYNLDTGAFEEPA